MDMSPKRETSEPRREPGRARAVAWAGVGAVVAGIVGMVWFIVSPEEGGLREVVTVDAAGDTLVYSGPVRDAIARARIVEAFNSVAAPDTSGAEDPVGSEDPSRVAPDDAERPEDPARSSREAAVDALARLYTGTVQPGAILAALRLAILDFTPGTATLPSDAPAFLQAAAEVLQRAPDDVMLVVIGHADEGPDQEADKELSERRARVVLDALVRGGVDEDRLRTEGRGSADHPGVDRGEGGSITFEFAALTSDEGARDDADEATGDTGVESDPGEAAGEPGVEGDVDEAAGEADLGADPNEADASEAAEAADDG